MKLFFDLFPVILFFIGFKLYDIFTATAIAIGATIALIIYSKLKDGKVERMLLVNGVLISVLGGITLLLKDKTFIMWKPTAIYWLLAIALLVSNIFFKKNLIQQAMNKMLNPPTTTWNKLNFAWVVFLVGMGFLNLYVAFNFSENTWVNFKLFGVTAMMFIFMLGQLIFLKDYLVEAQPTGPEEQNKD